MAESSLAVSWPPGQPRILVTDAWLANAGDAALAVATDELVKGLVPTASVLHAAYHSLELGRHLPGLLFTAPLEHLLGTPWVPPAPCWREAGPTLVSGADAVISQGGGFLMEAYQPWGRVAALAAAARQGIPLALYGQTIDHFTEALPRELLAEVMHSARLVMVRDAASVDNARDLGAGGAWLGADLALGMFPNAPGASRRQGVGLLLSDHAVDRGQRGLRAKTARVVIEATLEGVPGESVTMWSTTQGHPELAGEDDAVLAGAVLRQLSRSQRAQVEVVEGYVSPAEAIELVRRARAIVTMRLHPGLFAASLDTPFALVLGGQKATVLAETALADRVVSGTDEVAVRRAVQRAIGPEGGDGQWQALSLLRERLEAARARLAGFLGELPAGRDLKVPRRS